MGERKMEQIRHKIKHMKHVELRTVFSWIDTDRDEFLRAFELR
jgi:hypothetical protein